MVAIQMFCFLCFLANFTYFFFDLLLGFFGPFVFFLGDFVQFFGVNLLFFFFFFCSFGWIFLKCVWFLLDSFFGGPFLVLSHACPLIEVYVEDQAVIACPRCVPTL